jgi:hypothetical protein
MSYNDHKMKKIKYRNTDIIIEIDNLMIPVIRDFWDHDIDTYQCCQENDIIYEDERDEKIENIDIEKMNMLNHYPNIINNRAWIICQNKYRDYIEKTYNVEIYENNHLGYVVNEYVENYLKVGDFLFIIFNDLNKNAI